MGETVKLSMLVEPLKAELHGSDAEFRGVSTDTRTIVDGDLFVALKGEHFDGHDYLQQAFDKGAVAALVSKPVTHQKSVLQVEDTLRGLGALAYEWSARFSPRKVAITGSCGKTTLKEMVAAILSVAGPTLATRGNLNNEIGVPLTLLQLQAEHQYAVVECGANHVGEIAYTAGLVKPDVAVVNIVAPAHLEGFGSIDNVARAKGEIYDALNANGTAVINLDDTYASQYLQQTTGKHQITFALNNPHANVFAESCAMNEQGMYELCVNTPGGKLDITLSLIGMHNVHNALAATAIAVALGMDGKRIQAGLPTVKAAKGRLYPVADIQGYALIDDSYNANPASMRAAIDVLAASGRKTCLVLGAMGELGPLSESLHEEIGAYAATKGIGSLYGLGAAAEGYQRGYLQAGGQLGRFEICPDHHAIAHALKAREQDKLILVKGSRSTTMEKVIEALRDLVNTQGEQL